MTSGVFITLGRNTEIGAEDHEYPDLPPELVVRQQIEFIFGRPKYAQISLGKFTRSRIETLQKYLEQLKIHAVEED